MTNSTVTLSDHGHKRALEILPLIDPLANTYKNTCKKSRMDSFEKTDTLSVSILSDSDHSRTELFRMTTVQSSVVSSQEIHHSTTAPTEMTTVQPTVVSPQVIHHSTLAPTELSNLQKVALKKLSLPLTNEVLQSTIRNMFISMAANMSTSDPNSIRDSKLALRLNCTQRMKARLLLILGTAHSKKKEFNAAIKCYEQGLKITNANVVDKAFFHVILGMLYLAEWNPEI